ncbi:MAG TPA: phosphoribosylanthranilate isomerase [Longimicrobiaceae bacterium]|nr:phosphoribosylanthranilate isomerase [Longimicrobiaceae bacterium]
MGPTNRPRIKICCISSVDEAWTAIRHGASALGLVSAMPSGPGVIGEDAIAEIARRVPPGIASFLLTSATDADAVIEQQRRCGTNTVQLCDAVDEAEYEKMRRAMPGVALVQVIHVRSDESVDEALSIAPHVNAILLDSGNPSLAVKELGGTGRVHDWSLSRRIREAVDVPVYLAGGLREDNVADAIARVQPFGLDLCSSVRTDGKLDAAKLERFFAATVRPAPASAAIQT